METIKTLLNKASEYLNNRIENPRLEAELLLAHVFKFDRVKIYIEMEKPVVENEIVEYRKLISLRANGTPSAYLTGKKEFYSMSFKVGPEVLIPRPDTEHLVDFIKKNAGSDSRSVLDIGTGSGILIICIAKMFKPELLMASDISQEAIDLAQENARLILGEEHGINFVMSDIFSNINNKFDLIVSNPPYITEEEYMNLDSSVRDYEPRTALLAGKDGLSEYKKIFKDALSFLNPGGMLLLEISDTVSQGVKELAKESGFSRTEIHKDYSGHNRVFCCRA